MSPLTRWQRFKNTVAWLTNFHKCECEFYTGYSWFWKCNNCGGRLEK